MSSVPVDPDTELARRFDAAVTAADAAALREFEPGALVGLIDAPRFAFGAPALVHAVGLGDRDLVDALLGAGADPDARSTWEAGPYTALHRCVDGPTPARLELARHLVERGATVDLHAAAGLGRLDVLEALLDADPARVNEPGPDGATPLHLAATPAVASFLLGRGADLERRCVDHRSTPLMWSVDGREAVTRFLLDAGATPDLFVAAFLNDVAMVERILATEPGAIEVRVGPGASHEHLGHGDKYVWALGFADTPVEVARRRGHTEVYEALLRASPAAARLVQACRRGDVPAVRRLVASDPGLVSNLPSQDVCRALLGSPATTDVLLTAGMDPNRLDPDGATALHHAAWRGDRALAEVLLSHGADRTIRDARFGSTPLGWAEHNGQAELVGLLAERGP